MPRFFALQEARPKPVVLLVEAQEQSVGEVVAGAIRKIRAGLIVVGRCDGPRPGAPKLGQVAQSIVAGAGVPVQVVPAGKPAGSRLWSLMERHEI
ncbi:hypothetical protein [Meiothermus rufus]|uniref:hypothetical protein n=1 Tax=Meiothermus rufus TaxID=604332 RepID=UPI0003F4FF73|nr:hypothetical protein [Meiothermus rufus]